ncbi:MAG: type II toxin-antitoxin system Phd/YefM family antitoxin [Candidatus Dormibacteria bacterium]
MTKNLTATEARAQLLTLLDEVADGEEIEITKHGRTVARLVPATGPHSLRGLMQGVAMTSAEDEDQVFTTAAAWEFS